uniref:Uncharacterized protein n=1 Tax=Pseudoalteromonas rubra TaxID=43658 RepID=A0A0F4QEZ4_9GAMM|nr:hypothetical protein TW77_21415 [Pseudoalteromonas rubra]
MWRQIIWIPRMRDLCMERYYLNIFDFQRIKTKAVESKLFPPILKHRTNRNLGTTPLRQVFSQNSNFIMGMLPSFKLWTRFNSAQLGHPKITKYGQYSAV